VTEASVKAVTGFAFVCVPFDLKRKARLGNFCRTQFSIFF